MKVLFIGDVFGDIGRRVCAGRIGPLKTQHDIDVCIVNGENIAGGIGITLKLAKKLFKFGADIITGGNHSNAHLHQNPSLYSHEFILRPQNMAKSPDGSGSCLYPVSPELSLGVVNVMGRTFYDESLPSPFEIANELITDLLQHTRCIIVDFHAETTSEKRALAEYLSGRVSAVLGTHTHVQTADARILHQHTAFITDVGMTGPESSIIGMRTDVVLQKFLGEKHVRFTQSQAGPMLNGVIVEIEPSSGAATSIEPLFERISLEQL